MFLSNWSAGDKRKPPELGRHLALESVRDDYNKMFAYTDRHTEYVGVYV